MTFNSSRQISNSAELPVRYLIVRVFLHGQISNNARLSGQISNSAAQPSLLYVPVRGCPVRCVTVRGELSKSACLSVCSRVLNFPALFDPAGLGPDQLSV
jgi:hypothetical protein